MRADHHQYASKTKQCGDPAVGVHFFAQKPGGTNHDEDRAGKADGRHIGQTDTRQCGKPEHQPQGMYRATPPLPLHVHRTVSRIALAQHQRQYHQGTRKVAQKLCLKGIERQGDAAHNRI